jgi:ABC-type uncharacterized transport system auxiliary subunit
MNRVASNEIRPLHHLFAALLATLALAAGCSSSPPEVRHYQLDLPVQRMQAERAQTDSSARPVLAVESFSVDAAYDQPQIVYRESPYRLDQYYYQRWASMPGRLVSDAMRRGYEATGLFRTVLAGEGAEADAVLSGHISAIEEIDETEEQWFGHVVLQLRLRDAATGTLLWNRVYDERTPLKERSPTGLAVAVSEMLARIVEESAPVILQKSRQSSLRMSRRSGAGEE